MLIDRKLWLSRTMQAEFVRFILIGVTSTLIDFAVYGILLQVVDIRIAKAIGYIAGMTFSIFANLHWNFRYRGKDINRVLLKSCALYITALFINVVVNNAIISMLGSSPILLLVAFTAAVGVCTIYNFAGMKFWVFRAPRTPA